MGSFRTLEGLRSGMQELYSVQVGGRFGDYAFLADSSGQVPFLVLATKWLLSDSAKETPLCAEGDAVLYLNMVHPLLKILNINEILEEERSALARVIVDELIMLFCERWVGDMTEEEQSVYMRLPDDNTWAYMKRAMIMYKGILQPEGYLLTAKDILVLLQGITAEIQTIKSNTAAPAGDQEAKPNKIPGGFVGFCYRKICELQTDKRAEFLATNSGDSSFYCFRDLWKIEYKKTVKAPAEGISKAKALYRKLNEN